MSEELPQDIIEAAGVKDAAAPAHPAWLPFAIDFGPLLVFFLTFRLTKSDGAFGATAGAIKATGAFMVAIIIAMALSQWKLKKISPMLWMSAILVIGFGALTLYFHDARFIQIKPTVIYVGFAAMLLGGWWRGKPLLKYLLQAAYDGLSDDGWLKLSRNWGLFFIAMAVINEAMRATMDFDQWLTAKVWGVSILSFLFAMSQVPLMMRHGLAVGGESAGEG
ncbi:MAG: septation protein IspZ [Sphingopyxis sp.]